MNPVVQVSEEEVCAEARSLLKEAAHFSVQGLYLGISGGRLILTGSVRTFYHKQLAQELLRGLCRAAQLRIDNRLTVLEIPSE